MKAKAATFSFKGQLQFTAFFALVLVLGGSFFDSDWRSMLVQVVAVIAAFATFSKTDLYTDDSRKVFVVPTVLVLLVVFQLIPLPPSIFDELISDQRAAEVREVIGYDGFVAISVDPNATANFLSLLLLALVAYFTVWRASSRKNAAVILVVVGVALVSLVIAGLQFSSRGALLNFYDSIHAPKAIGFFANRNHQALFLAIAAGGGNYLVWTRFKPKEYRVWVSALLSAAFLIATIATESRTGFLLCGFSIVASAVLFGPRLSRKSILLFGIPLVAMLALIFFLLSQSAVTQDAAARFYAIGDDRRWEMWSVSYEAAKAYFPVGAGMGAFEPVYVAHEPLDTVRERVVNRAHNDYVEFLLEAGALAPLLLAALFYLLVRKAFRIATLPKEYADQAKLGLLWVSLALMHSIVDYPLRIPAHAVIFAVALGLVFGREKQSGRRQ